MNRLAILGVAAVLGGLVAWLLAPGPPPRTAGPLDHEVYVWQRAWTKGVREAVREHGAAFASLNVLAAEVSFDDGAPEVVRVDLDGEALRAAGRPIALSVRIGPYAGPFAADDEAARTLVRTVSGAVASLLALGIEPAEVQIDFDAAESKLAGYAAWLRAIRAEVGSIPLTITTLPAWLDRPELRRVLRETDGFVLQVHSLAPPAGPDAPWRLVDPEAARAAVERAARFGRPFRVALPTYGYAAAFRPDGTLLGISAEGPAPAWPADATVREVRADPDAMADLVAGWGRDRPAALRGVIWFRLPVPADRLGWRWPTLASAMAGRRSDAAVRIAVDRSDPALADVAVENTGDADLPALPALAVTWSGARLLAADAFDGWTWRRDGSGRGTFLPRPGAPSRLPAGARRPAGWLRFSGPARVDASFREGGGNLKEQ